MYPHVNISSFFEGILRSNRYPKPRFQIRSLMVDTAIDLSRRTCGYLSPTAWSNRGTYSFLKSCKTLV